MIDLKKNYQTRDGREVRLICTDGPDPLNPVVGFIKEKNKAWSWALDGLFDDGADEDLDLVEVTPKIVVEQWINIIQYNDGSTATDSFKREIDAKSQNYPGKVIARAVPFRWEGEG